jgi:hypothetical protein
MSGIRVLVGTRKGAFVLSSDGKRKTWDVAGPHFAGWEMYHLKGSPADPNRIYASQTSGWFGQVIQRSDDGGKTWDAPGGGVTTGPGGMLAGESNKFVYDDSPETGKPLMTHQFYDGTQKPWVFKRVWHLEPSLDDPDAVYAGVEDAALFRSTAAGWRGAGRPARPWRPGAGRGVCLHTILVTSRPDRLYTAISSAGAFRSGRRRRELEADLKATPVPLTPKSATVPPRDDPSRPTPSSCGTGTSCGRRRSATTGQRQPADGFGFVVDVHSNEPETVYVVPIKSDSEHFPLDGKLRVYRSRTGGNEWEALTNGLPQRDCYVNVLRDAMSVDSLDPCGVYFGTTGGQVYASADAGDSWAPIVRDLPAVLSVEVQTLR